MSLCTDPIAMKNGKGSRFTDNGWYVGHDEPIDEVHLVGRRAAATT